MKLFKIRRKNCLLRSKKWNELSIMSCWMKNYLNVLIFLNKFRELIETITKSTFELLKIILIKWTIFSMSLSNLLWQYLNVSLKHKENASRSCLKMKPKQLKSNSKLLLLKNGKNRKLSKKQKLLKKLKKLLLILKLKNLLLLQQKVKEKNQISPKSMLKNCKFLKLNSILQKWDKVIWSNVHLIKLLRY